MTHSLKLNDKVTIKDWPGKTWRVVYLNSLRYGEKYDLKEAGLDEDDSGIQVEWISRDLLEPFVPPLVLEVGDIIIAESEVFAVYSSLGGERVLVDAIHWDEDLAEIDRRGSYYIPEDLDLSDARVIGKLTI